MPTINENQKQFASAIEDDIRNQIKKDIDKSDDNDKSNPDGGDDSDEIVKNRKKELDNNDKKTDTITDGKKKSSDGKLDDDSDPSKLFNSVVDKIVVEEFDGDESKRDEAKGIANLAIKTFSGDPVKAAKSYKSLVDQNLSIKNLIKQNPFLDKLIKEANEGNTIDENFIKSLLGTATSNADQPDKSKKGNESEDQLIDIENFDIDSIGVDELVKSGVLDKSKYDAANNIDKDMMVEKARINYGVRVLPGKIAEQTLKVTEKKGKEKTENERRQKALETNRERLKKSYKDLITKYDVDFEGNPEHEALWEEIYTKASRVPDISDDSGLLVSEDAIERAAKVVFDKHGVEMVKIAGVDDETSKKPDSPHKMLRNHNVDVMKRILSGTNSFSGKAAGKQPVADRKPTDEKDTLSSKVNERVNSQIQRNLQTSQMISGVRKADNSRN